MFEPIAPFASALRGCAEWPSRDTLNALLRERGVANAYGVPLRAVAPCSGGASSYERRVHEHGELEVRERDWHDVFNVLAWCAYPATKSALNARHVAAAAADSSAANRGRARDALTLFDESGAIVVSTEPDLLEHLRAFRWKRLFWEERERVRASLRVYLFGHALLEKALAPYVGMTAHAITLRVDRDLPRDASALGDIDALAARHLASAVQTPRDLSPLPVLGVPGWWDANAEEGFYDDRGYFRSGRARAARAP